MKKIPDILKRITDHKCEELVVRKHQHPLNSIKAKIAELNPPRSFIQALTNKIQNQQPAVIAEIKKASPSKGVIREDFNVKAIAKTYQQAGAACISVLTDEKFFQGSDQYCQQAKQVTQLPILRKDFIIDPYQVYETRAIDADCILLIVAILDDTQLKDLYKLANELKLASLIEVHNEEELARALTLNTKMIGINNRDLHTFTTRLNTTLDLLQYIPKDKLVVTESGINSHHDIKLMREHDVHAFLVGEVLMSAEEPGEKLRELFF